ncbi:MAG: flagellar assembly peptidoglycan hydrolase FlgJ [Azoarcus sp.]|jgi:flagellar protein FlgJ|nr:flagellar assembly peptidoglycan hydrolase FlgJ [Azoarcus sp.]
MAGNGIHLNAFDPRSLGELRHLAKSGANSDEALRAASKQVEALFLHMMLKAMREAMPANGPMDSDQTRLAQALHDQQLASNLAQSKGAGLAEALFRQLSGGKAGEAVIDRRGGQEGDGAVSGRAARRTAAALGPHSSRWSMGEPPGAGIASAASLPGGKRETGGATAETASLSAKIAVTVDAARGAGGKAPEHVREFVASVWPYAHAASRATGIPAHFMVAQAALETGWGAKQLRNADGTPSYNLFNIKAGRGWDGQTTVQQTVNEYTGEGWQRQKAAFRSYSSYGEAFSDYAKLLTANPRYASVLGKDDAAAFAQGLQNAGYATDPMYADKLMRIIGGNTLRSALAMTA